MSGISQVSAQTLCCVYDFTTDGGAIGTINYPNPSIPINSLLISCFCKPVLTVASGGAATISIILSGGLGTVIGATGFANFTALATPVQSNIPFSTNMVRFSAAANFQIVIAGATITAGKFLVICQYISCDI